MLPGVGPGTVGQGIADPIIGDGLAIVTCQQVAPVGIAVGVTVREQQMEGEKLSLHLLAHEKSKKVTPTLAIHEYLQERNLTVIFLQASPLGDKRQFVEIIPSP